MLYQRRIEEVPYLDFMRSMFDGSDIEMFSLDGEAGLSRANNGGLIAVIGTVGGRDAAFLITDFRVNGGSFGENSSRKTVAFLKVLRARRIPLTFLLHSLGASIVEGRRVFNEAFRALPALAKFARENLLITAAVGRCLGIAAMVHGIGRYRLATSDKGQINLTGPEVLKQFFREDIDFDSLASIDRQFDKHDLVHARYENRESLLMGVRNLLRFAAGGIAVLSGAGVPVDSLISFGLFAKRQQPAGASEGPTYDVLVSRSEKKSLAFLGSIADRFIELFEEQDPVVKIFLARSGNRIFGIFMNPLNHPFNMFSVATLRKYMAGLALFDSMGIPAVSVLDTPGADPRMEETDRNIVGACVEMVEAICGYGSGLMGVVAGRCYGGASVLMFPKIYGGERVVALEGAQVGIMHKSILRGLLGGSPKMLARWEAVAVNETPDMQDVIANGSFDRCVPASHARAEVDAFLRKMEERTLGEVIGLSKPASAKASQRSKADQLHVIN